MIVLNTFLGCFQLRTGCLFIGYCGSISGILCLIGTLAGVVITALRENILKGDDKTMNEIIMGVFIYLMIISAISFSLHVVLLIGVYEKKTRLMNVYLGCMTAFLVLSFIVAIVVTVYITSRGFSFILSFALSIYYLIVIRSHRLEIEGAMSPPPYGVNNGVNKI